MVMVVVTNVTVMVTNVMVIINYDGNGHQGDDIT